MDVRAALLPFAVAFALAAAASSAAAQAPGAPSCPCDEALLALDLGLEEQPTRWSGRDFAPDLAVVHGGARALRLHRSGPEGLAVFSRPFPLDRARAKRVSVSGWIKTADVAGGWAGLWVRADRNGEMLVIDNMQSRGLTGTNDWTRVEVAIEVPAEATLVVAGALLGGSGTAWVDDLELRFAEPGAATAEVSGRVLLADGKPAAGAVVAVVAETGLEPKAVLQAAADGSFTTKVPPGSYAVTATHGGGAAAYLPPIRVADRSQRDVQLGASGGGFRLAGVVRDPAGAAVPAAEVRCYRFSEVQGDVFVTRADEQGRYAMELQSAKHSCRAVLAEQRSREREIEPGTAQLDLQVDRPTAAPQPVVDWVREQTVPLLTARSGHGFADMAPLRELVGGARVVALGEATHGTREIFQMKHRMLEYLVSELGFTVFAIEANWPESEAVNDYVLRGEGDPAAALAGLYFWTWNTEEVLDLIRWMRQWNSVPGHRQVSFYGFDVQVPAVSAAKLAERLQAVDAALAAEAKPVLAPFAPDQEADKAQVDALAALLPRAAAALARKPAPGRQAVVDQQLVRVLEQYVELAREEGFGGSRDQAMAANVRWIADIAEPGSRIAVWAHNGHIATSAKPFPWMGEHLEQALGDDYLPIGFLFHHGGFQAIDQTGRGKGLNAFTIGPPPLGSLEDTFERAGWPLGVLDLRALPASGPVGDWFRAPRTMRDTGAVFMSEEAMEHETVLPEVYEAVIYLEATTRARPNPRRDRKPSSSEAPTPRSARPPSAP